MANPQKENGYTALANEFIEALAKIRIPGESRQCLDVILRLTWGWNKKEDKISLVQFTEKTGICKPHVCRALSILIRMNMIIVTKKGNRTTEYMIQKDFEKWVSLPKKVTLPKKVIAITKKGNDEKPIKTAKNVDTISDSIGKTGDTIITNNGTHKTKYKTTITKPYIPGTQKEWNPVIKFLVEDYFKTLTDRQKMRFEKDREKFHDCCDKLMRIDGFSEEEIRKAVNFARNDHFWSSNFLSFSKLRQKNKDDVPWIEVFISKSGNQKLKERSSTQQVDNPDDYFEKE